MESGLVSCEWLHAELQGPHAKDVRVVNATWFMPGVHAGRDAQAEHAACRIPGATFFDCDETASKDLGLDHMMPDAGVFGAAMSKMGAGRAHKVVVYDNVGVFSAPRFWYTAVAYGHANVAVLDGGLPRWQSLGLPVEEGAAAEPAAAEPEEWALNSSVVWGADDVLANIDSAAVQLVDARSAGRFAGVDPEPRAGLRGGHVPGSRNVPFPTVMNADGTMKDAKELAAVFEAAGVEVGGRKIVATCGSGMTACVLKLAVNQVDGAQRDAAGVYDGSWTEWGGRDDTPVAVGAV